MATTLIDQYTLGIDATFQHRVQQEILTIIQQIHNETYTALTPQRDAFVKLVEANLAFWVNVIAQTVASDAAVAALAGSPSVQASVTDVAIANAVSAAWNSFAVKD